MSYQRNDAPPSYDQAITAATSPGLADSKQPQPRNNIPVSVRRSMEDEQRSLPPGWIRQFDPKSQHQFFVDTRTTPPRTIWHHPYDDLTFLKTLSHEERDAVQNVHKSPSHNYPIDADEKHGASSDLNYPSHGSVAASSPQQSSKKETFSQKMKDKLTGTTHSERESQRQQQAEAEQRALQRHQAMRHALAVAMETGQPQLIGKDKDGHDVYIEPPGGPGNGNPSGRQGAYNPYATSPVYADPNARFVRPDTSYSRPYGYGYGGGMGLPLAGGMMGGLMLGSMMGGGMGYGGLGMMGMGGMGGMGMGGMGL